jgi:hypothetical protein
VAGHEHGSRTKRYADAAERTWQSDRTQGDATRGALPELAAIPIARQVAEGLAEAEMLGVPYRDLSLGNVPLVLQQDPSGALSLTGLVDLCHQRNMSF